MEAKIYNQEGKSTGNVTLPAEIFGAKWNADLVHQVVVSMQSNARANTAHTKTRGEVRGGGIKPWRQKGTGRARHGSRRSPIWVGGGTTFGPRNDRNYSKKVNKKMSAKALVTLFSLKQKSGHIIFVDDLSFGSPKTKDANNVVKALSKISGFEKLTHKRKNNIFITLPKKDVKTEKSFKNLPQVKVGEIRNINPVDLVSNRYFVIVNPKDSISFIQSRLSK